MNDAKECLERFMNAVRCARKSNFEPGKKLVDGIRKRFGERAAHVAAKELKAFIRSDKKA